MNYAIYKSVNCNGRHILYQFKQEECGHQAKMAARRKLDEVWRTTLQRHTTRNHRAVKDSFTYENLTSTNTIEQVRIYIDRL